MNSYVEEVVVRFIQDSGQDLHREYGTASTYNVTSSCLKRNEIMFPFYNPGKLLQQVFVYGIREVEREWNCKGTRKTVAVDAIEVGLGSGVKASGELRLSLLQSQNPDGRR